ncbi:MAG: translation initiation factor IF-2 [Lachnospiraceae bacterium]|nr:translation initiation factor IF-2 [Lachnospiraceae bacterium]
MKISELAKDLNITSKEVIAFLQGQGFDYKSPQKILDADTENLVRKNMGAASAPAEKKEEKPEKKAVEKKPEEKAVVKEETEKKAEPVKENDGADAKKSESPKGEERPKKKKNIIFVGNPQNSKMGGQNAGRPQQRPQQPSQGSQNKKTAAGANVGPTRLIRPTTPPSPTPAMNFVPAGNPNSRHQNNVPKKEVTAEANETNKVRNEQPAQDNRGERNQGNFNRENRGERSQGGFNRENRGERNQGGFNRDKNGERGQGGFNRDRNGERGQGGFNRDRNGERGQGGFHKDGDDKGGRRDDNRFARKPQGGGRMFGGDAPVVEPEKHRDDEKRRISQEKDKKKKESSYEDGDFKGKGKGKLKPGSFIKPEKKVEEKVEDDIKVITIPDVLTLKDLADKMKLQPSAIVKKLFLKGEILTVNSEISFEKAEEIAIEYDIICEKEVQVDVIEELLKEDEEDEATMTERPPVICVMGHVDHGKTSLLDAIRKTHVTDREAGGITQHIGAYMVSVQDRKITFLDTPGHEAFTAMRMRGANATDIAILVVAADDGVMPQTKEAINHAKAAGVQIIVAVNKVDKIGYDFNDPSRKMDSYPSINNLMRELAEEHELLSEDWGGTTIFAPVSAKMGLGINELLDMILLSADMLELKANAKRQARGLVIEAELDKGRGPVATILVQKGTLHVGDFISAGEAHGKVRAMVDDKGRRVKEAAPSTPVEILGLNGVPNAGEIFISHKNDKEAKSFAETFVAQNKVKLISDTKAKMSLDDLFSKIQEGNLKELNLIVKADVQGSVEAVKQSLVKLSNEEVAVKVIHGGVGAINESDVILASAAKAIIIGFNVRVDNMAKDTVEKEGVDVRLYSVIYQAIEDVEAAMKGMLDPIFEEKVIGHAQVRQIFKASAIGNIAGSYVLDGVFQRNALVRITRGDEQIYEGKLASLKRFKDDVKEVKAGFECGLVFEDFDKMMEDDIVEAYIMVEVPR